MKTVDMVVNSTSVNSLYFGMTMQEVEKHWGPPDKLFLNQNGNAVHTYFRQRTHLTFEMQDNTWQLIKFETASQDVLWNGVRLGHLSKNALLRELEKDGYQNILVESDFEKEILCTDNLWITVAFDCFSSIMVASSAPKCAGICPHDNGGGL